MAEPHSKNDHYHYLSADERTAPVPMLPSEIVRIETAMFFAQVSGKTIRKWAQRDGIGRQAEKHSPLQISFPALLMRLDGDTVALERLRSGDRQHPHVAAYLARGIDLLEEIRTAAARSPQYGGEEREKKWPDRSQTST